MVIQNTLTQAYRATATGINDAVPQGHWIELLQCYDEATELQQNVAPPLLSVCVQQQRHVMGEHTHSDAILPDLQLSSWKKSCCSVILMNQTWCSLWTLKQRNHPFLLCNVLQGQLLPVHPADLRHPAEGTLQSMGVYVTVTTVLLHTLSL